jgi:hypothetical protein
MSTLWEVIKGTCFLLIVTALGIPMVLLIMLIVPMIAKLFGC